METDFPRHLSLLKDSVMQAETEEDMRALLLGLKDSLALQGIFPDRIQIPMTAALGFRHPTMFGIALTWTNEKAFEDTFIIQHSEANYNRRVGLPPPDDLDDLGPYAEVIRDKFLHYHCSLETETPHYDILKQLKEAGYVDYLAFGIVVEEEGFPQVVSLSAKNPFPADSQQRLRPLLDLYAIAFRAAYKANKSKALATTYLGTRTGVRALNGEIVRGCSEAKTAGLIFCDIRGYTALTERLGGEKIIPLMNDLFDVIAEPALSRGGEILKFIGDAMLLMFDAEDVPRQEISTKIVDSVRIAIQEVRRVSIQTGIELDAGFGCHIDTVMYGNIGTKRRLDYTVMGPSVNLTSRLESLTKQLQTNAVFSKEVAKYHPELIHRGEHALKGISEPVSVWCLPSATE